jgi:hypothetical protein
MGFYPVTVGTQYIITDNIKVKVKFSPLQALEALRVLRG